MAGPTRTLAENSSMGKRKTEVCFSSLAFGWRVSAQRPGRMCSERRRRASRFSQDHHRAVIHGLIEDRAGEYESIKQRHGEADGNAFLHVAQHAACGGAVNIEVRVFASVGRGNYEGLAVDDEANVAEEAFVENAVSGLAIVNRAMSFADDTSPRAGRVGLGHWKKSSGKRQGWVKGKCNTGKRAAGFGDTGPGRDSGIRRIWFTESRR